MDRSKVKCIWIVGPTEMQAIHLMRTKEPELYSVANTEKRQRHPRNAADSRRIKRSKRCEMNSVGHQRRAAESSGQWGIK